MGRGFADQLVPTKTINRHLPDNMGEKVAAGPNKNWFRKLGEVDSELFFDIQAIAGHGFGNRKGPHAR